MAEDNAQTLAGPDLRAGVKFNDLVEGEPLLGHFDGEPVILVRHGEQVFDEIPESPGLAHETAL